MGGAVLQRLIDAKFANAGDVFACDIDQNRLVEIRDKFGVTVSTDNREGARFGDLVVLAVPPKESIKVLEDLRDILSKPRILVSLVALVSTSLIEKILRSRVCVVRVMPNIPSIVGQGFSLFSFGRYVTPDDEELVKSFLDVLGEHLEVDEQEIELYSVLSAMGPTYFLPFVEALIRFGVCNGLTYAKARKAVASTLRGTAELILKSSRPVDELKNMIGARPLDRYEEQIASTMELELNRTLQQIKHAKESFAR